MTTKTDHHAIIELRKVYTPAHRGIITTDEAKMIREILEIVIIVISQQAPRYSTR